MLRFNGEAEALTQAMHDLRGRGITALPIHDAVAVNHRHAETTRVVMEDTFRRVVGVEGLAVVETYSKHHEPWAYPSPQYDQEGDF